MVQLKTKDSMADSFPNCWTRASCCFSRMFFWYHCRHEGASRIFCGEVASEVSLLKRWMAIEQAEEAPKKRKAESLEGPDWTSRYCAMAAVTAWHDDLGSWFLRMLPSYVVFGTWFKIYSHEKSEYLVFCIKVIRSRLFWYDLSEDFQCSDLLRIHQSYHMTMVAMFPEVLWMPLRTRLPWNL